MSQIRDKFLDTLAQDFASLPTEKMGPLISENLLSPFKLELASDLLEQAKQFVHVVFKIRQSENYQSLLSSEIKERGLVDPGNKAIAMSYDFHVSANGTLKLIEINTNASFLALGHWVYKAHELPTPIKDFSIQEIKDNILKELSLFGRPTANPKVSIIDETPEEQRLYAEFLLYQALMNSWGFKTQIEDVSSVSMDADFIYNRHTDFYLQNENSKLLFDQYQKKEQCFSPNPFEYFLLADKQRMIDLRQAEFVSKLGLTIEEQNILWRNLPAAEELTPQTAERIWSARKTLFFKPKRSFGAKQSFKGASISRKAFDELPSQGFLAQEYVPAPERKFFTPSLTAQSEEQSFKYDLRFYVYQDRVQSVVARLYQGQVTNLRTPYGGFAPVLFI